MKVILFDGECGFCAASIQFVWKRDREGRFHFASIQSKVGQTLLAERGIADPQLDTMYFLDEEKTYDRSEAGLRICKGLPRYRGLASLGLLVPRFLRDRVYNLVARNRRRLNTDGCELPPPEVQRRFLDREN